MLSGLLCEKLVLEDFAGLHGLVGIVAQLEALVRILIRAADERRIVGLDSVNKGAVESIGLVFLTIVVVGFLRSLQDDVVAEVILDGHVGHGDDQTRELGVETALDVAAADQSGGDAVLEGHDDGGMVVGVIFGLRINAGHDHAGGVGRVEGLGLAIQPAQVVQNVDVLLK